MHNNAMLRRTALVKRRGKFVSALANHNVCRNQRSGTRLYSASPPSRTKANSIENTRFNKVLVQYCITLHAYESIGDCDVGVIEICEETEG